MSTYTTVSGDTFDSIAKNQLGNKIYIKDLMEANPRYITTVIFSSGIELTLPEVDISTTTTTINTDNLPPWRS